MGWECNEHSTALLHPQLNLLVVVFWPVGHWLVAGSHPHQVSGACQPGNNGVPRPVLAAGAVRDEQVPLLVRWQWKTTCNNKDATCINAVEILYILNITCTGLEPGTLSLSISQSISIPPPLYLTIHYLKNISTRRGGTYTYSTRYFRA